ncbi:hypothetical protein [Pedobacter nanyangensis]|uniref:hypothetical protein n=1 Tax=Pedobacter nanyangensis TaxID=1562389 RepID=UPI000DE26AFE|nr:hypothetical protein [Pedobacter nanyangensis]
MKTAYYTKTPQGDGFLFNVTPAPKTNGGCAGMFLYIALASLGAMLVGGLIGSSYDRFNQAPMIYGIIAGLIVFVLIMRWGLKRDPRPANHRLPSSFAVYPNRIEMNGQKMNKEDIHRVIIRNTQDNSTIVLGPPSLSQSAGLQMGDMIKAISYSLNIESGGRTYQIAGGLDEVTANGLLTDVSRILGFS